jgi:DNA-binding GntR family transcriptional regulator
MENLYTRLCQGCYSERTRIPQPKRTHLPSPLTRRRKAQRLAPRQRLPARALKQSPGATVPLKGRERQLVEPAVRAISDRITSRAISPGNRISEQDLCDEFRISRSTAREVLAALQQRGLVLRPPNRSAIVTRFTAAEIYETFNIREVLEGLCFRLAVENERPGSWQDLVDLYGAPMEDIVRRGDFAAQLKNIDHLIARVRTAARNTTLCMMLDSIDVRSRYVICRTLILRGRLEVGLTEVRAVIAAMRRGDAAEAEALRRQNIRSQKEFFRQHESLILN